ARAGRDCQRNAVWCRCGPMPGVPESTLTEAADLRRVIKTLSRVTPWRPLYHIVEVWSVIAAAVYASVMFVPPSSGLLGGLVYVAAVAVVASRQHALMVLTHE